MAYVNTVGSGTSATYLHAASGLSAAACTFAFWVKDTNWAASPGNGAASYGLVGAAPTSTDGFGAEGDPSPGQHVFDAGNVINGPEPAYTTPGSDFNGWVWFCFTVSSGGVLTTYAATETNGPKVLTTGTCGTITDVYFAGNPFAAQANAGKYAAMKYWTAALSAAEVAREWSQQAPVRTTNLYSYLSCSNGTTVGTDQSGNGHNLTLVGAGTITTDTDLPTFGARVLQSVQATNAATGTTIAATLGAAVTPGSTLLVFASNKDTSAATVSCSDNVNGSYTSLDSLDDATQQQRTSSFYVKNVASGSTTATVTFSVTSTLRAIELVEVVGVTANPLDGHTGQVQANPGAGTDAVTSGPATNLSQPALMVGLSMDNRTTSPAAPAAGTGFTDLGAVWNIATGNQARLESKRLTTTGSQSATFTGTAGVAPTTLMVMLDEVDASTVTNGLFFGAGTTS